MKAILAPSGRLARAELRLSARYEAAYQNGKDRSQPVTTARHIYRDLTPAARRRLVDLSADLVDNSPFICGLIERLVTYVIGGTGIYPLSASKDEKWATEADAVFKADTENLEWRGGVDWAGMQAQAYRCELRDGDCGFILTDEVNPTILAVEGRDIGDRYRHTGDDYFDGLKLDSLGRVVSYAINTETPNGITISDEVPFEWFVHQLDPRRIGQRRGVPILASALNTARDIHDILTLEKLAVKEASSKTDIIETATGELNAEDYIRTGGTTLNGSDSEEAAKYYREIVGPEAKVIKAGDKYTPYVSDRPGPAWQGFMAFLSETVCLSAGIPPSVLLQLKVGGADTRRDLAAAARRFEQDKLRIARQHTPLRNFFIQKRIDDKTLYPAPPDWKQITWQFPKDITVDAGREAQQDREDMRSGAMTEQEFHGRWGVHWRRHNEQLEVEARAKIRRAKKIANDEGIPLDLALELIGKNADSPSTAIVMPKPAQQHQPVVTQ